MSDPLITLVRHLSTDGKPPLPWLIEHAPDGTLAKAWDASESRRALLCLLGWGAPVATTAEAIRAALYLHEWDRRWRDQLLRNIDRDLAMRWRGQALPTSLENYFAAASRSYFLPPAWRVCAAIRRVAPSPPALADLLAAVASAHAPNPGGAP